VHDEIEHRRLRCQAYASDRRTALAAGPAVEHQIMDNLNATNKYNTFHGASSIHIVSLQHACEAADRTDEESAGTQRLW
jgi:hypothetical protein